MAGWMAAGRLANVRRNTGHRGVATSYFMRHSLSKQRGDKGNRLENATGVCRQWLKPRWLAGRCGEGLKNVMAAVGHQAAPADSCTANFCF